MFVQAKMSADVALVRVISPECKTVFFLWPLWVIIEHLDGKPGFLLCCGFLVFVDFFSRPHPLRCSRCLDLGHF